MNISDLETLEDGSYHNTRERYENPVRDEVKSISSPVVYGDGSQTRDFVFIKDVVNVFKSNDISRNMSR